MDIFKLLNDQDILKKIGKSVGADSNQVKEIAQLGLPALMQALGKNASSTEGAEALASALDDHQGDNIEDINGFLNNVKLDDGAKILKHIFADKNDVVQDDLAKQTGLKSDQVSGIMEQLAPLLLGSLGKEKKKLNLDASGIAGLLGGLLTKGDKSGLMGMFTNLLDSDKDGSIVDDVGNIFKGFIKK